MASDAGETGVGFTTPDIESIVAGSGWRDTWKPATAVPVLISLDNTSRAAPIAITVVGVVAALQIDGIISLGAEDARIVRTIGVDLEHALSLHVKREEFIRLHLAGG